MSSYVREKPILVDSKRIIRPMINYPERRKSYVRNLLR